MAQHPEWYRIKAAYLERKQSIAEAEAVFNDELIAAGLDPQKQYTLNATEKSITEVVDKPKIVEFPNGA